MPAGSSHDLHQLCRRRKEPIQTLCPRIDYQSLPQVRLLGSDAHRTVVGMTRPHAETPDGLDGRVRHRDCIGAERERLDEIGRQTQATGNHQSDVLAAFLIQETPGAGESGNRRN